MQILNQTVDDLVMTCKLKEKANDSTICKGWLGQGDRAKIPDVFFLLFRHFFFKFSVSRGTTW